MKLILKAVMKTCYKTLYFLAWLIVSYHTISAQAEVQNPTFPFWKVNGNSGTNSSTNYIGTTDNVSLRFRTANIIRMSIDSNGRVGIATTTPATRLDVNGDLALRERVLTLANGINSNVPVDSNTFFRVTGPVSLFALTGLAGGVDGKIVTLFNNTSSTMFIDAMALSLPANQILTGAGDLFVADSGSVTMQYNSTIAKWVVTSYNNASYGATAWNLTGNALTTPGTNFMGTIDNQDVMFKRNGFQAGLLGTTNTAWGDRALITNSTGNNNTTVGSFSLDANNTGSNNSGLGVNALTSNTSGGFNVAVGKSALNNNSVGNSNVAVGVEALFNNTIRSNLVAVGDSALYNNGVGATLTFQARDNVAVGSKALFANTLGTDNMAVGNRALFSNTSGISNTASGSRALFTNSTGSNNTANGYQALAANSTGLENSAHGADALTANTLGNKNIAAGKSALMANTSGSYNVAAGHSALVANTTGNSNVAVGIDALNRSATRSNIVAVGDSALYNNGVGATIALHGSQNTAVGSKALMTTATGSQNTAVGFNTMMSNAVGVQNVAVGSLSLSAVTSGSGNTAVGANSGLTALVASSNTFLGNDADAQITTISNSAAIGNNAKVSEGSTMIFGDTIIRPKVGIGVTAVGKTLPGTFMEIARTGAANQNILTRFAGTGFPAIFMQRSLGTLAVPTITTSGQLLGSLSFGGYDGVDWENAAYIDVVVDSTTGADVMPSRIEFFTRSATGSVPQERMEINRNGHVGIGTSVQQTSLHVNGGVVLEAASVTVTADNFLINVGNRSYLKVNSDFPTATGRTILLSDGLFIGQILYIEGAITLGNQFEILEPTSNVQCGFPGTSLVMTLNDIAHFIWNGTDWLLVSYSGN
jgi:hypothetical protein